MTNVEQRDGATARPWLSKIDGTVALILDATGNRIAYCYGAFADRSESEQRANAELIVTAVSSHDALMEKVRALAALLPRIDRYFGNGGLWNPEHMEHDKVSELLLDIRKAIRALGDGR